MKRECMQFLTERLEGLTLTSGVKPFLSMAHARSIFFRELPVDYLKDNDYAVCCLPLIDRNVKYGSLIGKSRNLETRMLHLVRRRYRREIVFRCLMYGLPDELYGTELSTGLAERFIQSVAGVHHIIADDNSVILVNPQDTAQPWDRTAERDRSLGRPALAIIRVEFRGGVQVESEVPLITGVEINPQVETV